MLTATLWDNRDMGIHTHKSTGVHTHTQTQLQHHSFPRNRKLVEFLFMSREGRSLSLTDRRSLSLTDLFRETTVSNDGTNRTTKKLRRRTESGLRKSVCVWLDRKGKMARQTIMNSDLHSLPWFLSFCCAVCIIRTLHPVSPEHQRPPQAVW